MRLAFGMLNWQPAVFWSATLTEFFEAAEGLRLARGGEEPIAPPSEDDLAALVARYS